MKKLFLVATASVILLTTPSLMSASNAQPQHLLLKHWPFSIRGKTVGGGTSFGSGTPASPDRAKLVLFEMIKNEFNPENISSAKTKLRYSLKAENAILTWKLISSDNADKADNFYCEQFFWELGVLQMGFGNCITEVEFSRDKNFWPNSNFDELLSPDRRKVQMHFVPGAVASNYNGLFSPGEDIHCPANVVSLDSKEIKSQRLKEFRNDWTDFLAKHRYGTDQAATRDSVISFAKHMQAKYADFFEEK